MKPTRLDVARLAGVSPATVSNVMNNAQKVRGETVERVQAAMAQLNYQPNMVARSLTTRKTMQIGLVLENIRNPYYGEIVEHFEAAASARGYFVNICIGTQNIDHYLDNFVTRRLDGLATSSRVGPAASTAFSWRRCRTCSTCPSSTSSLKTTSACSSAETRMWTTGAFPPSRATTPPPCGWPSSIWPDSATARSFTSAA